MLQVLEWPSFDVSIHIPKRAQRIPELLTRRKVARILNSCVNRKHRMMLMTCYGCGQRVSELVRVKVRHIDGGRHLLRTELLKRVFDIDIEHCHHCGGTLKIIAAIEDPAAITKMLAHLGSPTRAPP